ncbi:hypothetical protein SEA_DAUBENSKI_249 [Streptomyces phage Daubenski]|uniref:Uncharacterized protein n=1 Tax=Streptomyces phage Daubenski TaxID=2653725 RepID=A0A5Q2WD01_9CAUD|nr:hypothetical protein KNU80_gp005 [Streptomyces phage Daubenski]YP_010104973.1 hypothetical protein KNU80_gp056 [Streptomyces phage Daubenski]QGH76316.1 hypothetical protein SEA_DAUBENSKI_5 [Streptomyces phage Daubenski]QGH76514.1 hypothetical protein SEA_DAUBENSKI_249 [Streptomyces phage Daubenski]
MSLWTLDSDRLVRIFHNNGIRMSLKKAFEVARIVEDLHSQRVIEVENNAWDLARKETDTRVTHAYDEGFEAGRRSGQRNANYTAEQDHTQLVTRASIWANGEFSHYDLNTKIRCIKHLRQNFPTLDLRTAKYIVESISGEGVGVRW